MAGLLRQLFLKTFAMELRSFCGFLISYTVPTMVVVVGLPYYRPFMAKLHYTEFWVTSYNSGGWPLKPIFSQNFRDGAQNLSWVLNIIYCAHNGWVVGLPYYRPFMAKLHYIEFWVISDNRGDWPLKQFFLKTFAMESKTFSG